MSWNWGKSIAVVIGLFMIFILSFVYKAFTRDVDLVAEDYYQQEIDFQEKIDAKSNANGNEVNLSFLDNELIINLNEDIPSGTKVTFNFKRPNDANLDKEIVIEDKTNDFDFNLTDFVPGKYTLYISWTNNDKNFLIEKDLML